MDNGDPESPNPDVQPVPTSNTTVEDLRHTISSTTDANLTTGEGFFLGSEPSQAMTNNEVAVTNLPSTQITNADSTTTRNLARRTSAGSTGDVTDTSQQIVSKKQCGRDVGDLRVRKMAPTKPTSEKPVEQFSAPRRREITRFDETDPITAPPPGKLLGRGLVLMANPQSPTSPRRGNQKQRYGRLRLRYARSSLANVNNTLGTASKSRYVQHVSLRKRSWSTWNISTASMNFQLPSLTSTLLSRIAYKNGRAVHVRPAFRLTRRIEI